MSNPTFARSTDPDSALAVVRRTTAERHSRLEALPSQARLLCRDYQPTEYATLLQRLYGFYDPLCTVLAQGDYLARFGLRIAARLAGLRLDLLELGLPSAEVEALPRCAQLPPLDTPDRVLGSAYVIEGSALGGRVITKHLMRVFPASGGSALRFFAGDGERTREHWERFCARLNAEARDIDRVCVAACATFDALTAWLAQPAPQRLAGAGRP